MSQQEIIDLAIASYLKTNDNTARQYLKLRQEALEVTQKVRKEVLETATISPETALQLEKLKFENAKIALVYKAYLDNISSNLETKGEVGGQISARLNERFDEISEKKLAKDEAIDQLRKEHKPVVEKMRLLASKFDSGIAGPKNNPINKRTLGEERIFTRRGSESDDNSLLMNFASAVFNRNELEEQFADVESKLANLKTVDEVSNDVDGAVQENAPSIELTKYLDELLLSGRAYQRVEDSTYHFDVTKSSSSDLGGPRAVISDYESSIETLTKEIQGLVARGTEAKERWINNAQKIEMIQALLHEDMEIDG